MTDYKSASTEPLLSLSSLGGGRACLDNAITKEWNDHRNVWLGGSGIALVLAVLLTFIQGANPWWAGMIYNIACVALLIAFFALIGIMLVWRHIRGLASKLHFEERRVFLEDAGRGLLKYLGGVVAAVIAAEAVIYCLPLMVLP